MSCVFYPGCSLDSTARDYYLSTQAVAGALGLELPEIPDWTCCGSTPAHQSSELLALALPAQNLLAARGKTVAVCCAACYSRLKAANHTLAHDPKARAAVAEALGADYDGSTPVKHLLEIIVRDIGLKKVAERVVRPLKGLRVAAYYGCLLVRPPEVTQFDDPENPTLMDDVLAAAGAETLDWPHKTECCGASYSITDVSIVHQLTRDVLAMARDAGANCIATACPLCQLNLDLRQREIAEKFGESFDLPVFYFTQLLGLAFGLKPAQLGLRSLVVNPEPLLAAAGMLGEQVAGQRQGCTGCGH
ncbi:MAG: CoB--CoM heterodisulfide reductase iron-sulfur subunit B family protein [Planctomycetota bacterium]|nr:CoB--CoM heterodisulfide reductase iron-sulfur subunit B family protein [Planctomycetota bacterium]